MLSMATSKELLSDILEGVVAVQLFLTDGLGSESLSPGCEAQRHNASKALEKIVKKIQNAHPSIRPRVNTPGSLKKPAPPPPSSPSLEPPLPEENEGEVYEEPVPDPSNEEAPQEAEDYLSFAPTHSNGMVGNGEQEVYEAMEADQQDVYEEPVSSTSLVENYEDPVNSRPNTVSTTSLPYSFTAQIPQDQIPEEGEYAETFGMQLGNEQQQIGESMDNLSMDWGNVYTSPPKGEKLKVSSLTNVKIRGPLEKLGGKKHTAWQKRYCVLAGPLMYFYEKENSKSYNNCIAVLSFKVSQAPNVTNEKKKNFGFKLTQEDVTGKHKDYYFRATTAELRDKWLMCIQKVEATVNVSSLLSPSASQQACASTLPRMPSHVPPPMISGRTRRARSVGQEDIEEGELYEDMAVPEDGEGTIEEADEEMGDEYVAVNPGEEDERAIELESSEEYVDIVPAQGEVEQEEYEDTTNFQQPPPPLSLPPGPPSEIFMPPPPQVAPPFKAPAPPPPELDTSIVYTQDTTCGILLENVYVSLWNFAASEEDELGLQRGDLVYVNRPLDSQMWWYGELLDNEASRRVGRAGFFPKDYSMLAFEAVSS